MNDISKLTLSDEEQQLVNNSDWILTKRIIIDKIYALFGHLANEHKAVMEDEKDPIAIGRLPNVVLQSTAKISKGENYLQLPYVLLDYPRCFDTENIFAVRTMFWWGNFFSVTLLLSGKYKHMFEQKMIRNTTILLQKDFYLCISESLWHHHFEADNYVAVRQLAGHELEQIIRQKEFVKIAVRFPLQQWKAMHELLEKSFADILELLKD